MKKIAILLSLSLIVISCKEDINDSRYSNQNWAWYVGSSGQGEWIPVNSKMGVDSGFVTQFYSTGEIYATTPILNGEHSDTIKIFSKEGGLLKFKVPSKNEQWQYASDGPYQDLYPTGEIRDSGFVKDGQFVGEWKSYSKNGYLEYLERTDGINDTSRWYYPSGQLKSIGFHTNGIQEGESIHYFENGLVEQELKWQQGLMHGAQFYYDSEGELLEIQHWKNGVKVRMVLFENGEVVLDSLMNQWPLSEAEKFTYRQYKKLR